MLKHLPLAAFSLLALFAPARAEDVALPIDIRRLDVMMDQVRDIEAARGLAPPAERPAASAPFDVLHLAVDEYNDLLPVACSAHLVAAALCTGPWTPVWLAPGAYDDAKLRAMTDEAAVRLMPFWQAVCAAAPPSAEPVCPME